MYNKLKQLLIEGVTTGLMPRKTGIRVGKAITNINRDLKQKASKGAFPTDGRMERVLRIRKKVVDRFVKKQPHAKKHGGKEFDDGYNLGDNEKRIMLRRT